MMCPFCKTKKQVPTWKTCNKRECERMYVHIKDVKLQDIDIKYIHNIIAKHKKQIDLSKKELKRLNAIKKFYFNFDV